MRATLAVVVILLLLAALFAILNPALLTQESTASLLGRQYDGPLVAVLLVTAAGTWVLLLGLAGLMEWRWRRHARALAAEVAAREQQILQLKAAAYDQQVAPPAPGPGASETQRATPA